MARIIANSEIELMPRSVVSDLGLLFLWRGRLFRGIHASRAAEIRELFHGGLLSELIENKLFPHSWITDYRMEEYNLIIEHEKISLTTYPYEWSFSMLKDAALAFLKTNEISQRYGYQLKDGHPSNILFDGLEPRFVDLGSFIKVAPGFRGVLAWEEFLRSFYYPLKIAAKGYRFLSKSILSLDMECMPTHEYLAFSNLAVFERLFPRISHRLVDMYFKFLKIFLYSPEEIKAKVPGLPGKAICFLKQRRLLPFAPPAATSIMRKVARLEQKGVKPDSQQEGTQRIPYADRISAIIQNLQVSSVLELGQNDTSLSPYLLENGLAAAAIFTDAEEAAVEALYRRPQPPSPRLQAAVLNSMFPITRGRGCPVYERFRADLVIAPTLTRHLLLSAGLKIDFVLQVIGRYTNKYVLLGFLGRGGTEDPPPWYNRQWFREAFENYFKLVLEEELAQDYVLFVGEVKPLSAGHRAAVPNLAEENSDLNPAPKV